MKPRSLITSQPSEQTMSASRANSVSLTQGLLSDSRSAIDGDVGIDDSDHYSQTTEQQLSKLLIHTNSAIFDSSCDGDPNFEEKKSV